MGQVSPMVAEKNNLILKFFASLVFWLLVLAALLLLTFLAGIILGYVPIQEST